MMNRNISQQPTPLTGALVGGLLAAPLLAVFYLAAVMIGTPFPPFDLFDWLARVLPGSLIRAGINFIVSIIAALNLEDTSRSAKTAEHILAMALVAAALVAAGAVLFALLRRGGSGRLAGAAVGLALGLPLAALGLVINTSASALPPISAMWTAAVFAAWGAACAWIFARLSAAPSPAAAGTSAAVYVLDRRRFLIQLGGAAATLTVAGAGLGALLSRPLPAGGEPEAAAEPGWSDANALPNANDPLIPAPGTRPEFTPVRDHYRIDVNSLPPVLNEDDWTLSVFGLVDNPLELTLADLRGGYEPLHQFVTLSCISNPVGGDLISTQRWTGVPLRVILDRAKPQVNGGYVRIRSADGFDEILPITDARQDERIMLVYAWDGLPLPVGHGFPLRIYIPNLYGMKQPKWIVSLEITDRYEEDGYWVRKGWDEVARVKSTAVIDTIAGGDLIQDGDRTLVPVGGIAFAGSRGISRVEVRVNEGEWQPAQLRAPLSETTWVIWRYDWPFQAGHYLFEVRCVDGNGTPQIEEPRDVYPSGATGLHTRRANL